MGERRNSRRSKSFLRGFVYVSRKRGALSCLIRDLSEKGARIIFSDQVTLPDVVDLYIPQREQTLRARVQWRRNDEIGLAFDESRTGAGRRRAERRRSHPARRHAGSRNRLAAHAAQAPQERQAGRRRRSRRPDRSRSRDPRLHSFRPDNLSRPNQGDNHGQGLLDRDLFFGFQSGRARGIRQARGAGDRRRRRAFSGPRHRRQGLREGRQAARRRSSSSTASRKPPPRTTAPATRPR